MDTATFLKGMTSDFREEYPRVVYKLVAKQDPAFRWIGKQGKFHLSQKETNDIDRFVFLYLCKKMLEAGETELALTIYKLREKGFLFVLRQNGEIGLIPKEETKDTLREDWKAIPLEKRTWIQHVFQNMSQDFPEVVDLLTQVV